MGTDLASFYISMAPPKLAITCSINKKDVVGLSLEEEALTRQWIEYKKVIIDRQPITENILSELDSHLKTRSYMTGNKLSKADFEIHGDSTSFIQTKACSLKKSIYPCQDGSVMCSTKTLNV